MWTVYIGPLLPGVQDRLGEYYDRPFDVFESYYDSGIYRLSYADQKKLGPSKQMDWGSWLYVCDRKTLKQFAKDHGIQQIVHVIPAEKSGKDTAVRETPTEFGGMPKTQWYGILDVELD